MPTQHIINNHIKILEKKLYLLLNISLFNSIFHTLFSQQGHHSQQGQNN